MIYNPVEFRNNVAEELRESLNSINQQELDEMTDLIISSRRVFLTGAGMALLMMRVLAMLLVQNGITAYVVGDVTTPSLHEGDSLIAASYSGTTASTFQFIEKAVRNNGRIGLFTATAKSPIASKADVVVMVKSDSDHDSGRTSVCYEGDGFVQTLMPLVHCVSRLVGEKIGSTEETMLTNHANIE